MEEKKVMVKPMQVVFAILIAIAIVIGYLLALNGRYTTGYKGVLVFDKWTGKLIDLETMYYELHANDNTSDDVGE